MLMAPLMVKDQGYLTGAVLAALGIVASHPFEVARILTIADPGNPLTSVGALKQAQGWEGLLRGLGPRSLMLFPVMFAGHIINSHTYRTWHKRQHTVAKAPAINTYVLF